MSEQDLDDLLTPKPSPVSLTQRDAILAQSLTVLRRRDSLGKLVAMILAFFIVGVATGWYAKPVPSPTEPVIIREIIEVPVAVPQAESPSESVVLTLDQLETQAELADAPTAAKLYRRVADEYLKQNDIAAATRCYRLHLNELGREGLDRKDDDSWLLIAMKSSTRKETHQ